MVDLSDALYSQLKKSQSLYNQALENGDHEGAKRYAQECSRRCVALAKNSPKEKKKYLELAEKWNNAITSKSQRTVVPTNRQSLSEEENSFGKIRDLNLAEKPNIRFKDIAGLNEVKEQIKEAIVYPFKHQESYQYYDVSKGGGILLYGPPGCGKTMLAAAAAAECDATFISLKISDIKDKYVGESEKKIKEVFNLAREYERAIIFFDEMDALATDRSDSGQGHEKSLVNELLAQMDGVDTKGSNQYLLLAATNLPWAIDSAIRRPGRFNKSIFIPQPDFAARKKLFQIYLKKKPVSKRLNIDELARNTEGFASAEIRQVCEDAAKIPLREVIKGKAKREISGKDFEQAISDMQTILASWYMKATRELKKNGEEDAFLDLMKAGEAYGKK